MKRREFPRAVRVAVIKRATRDGVLFCEECAALAKKPEIDHRNPDGLTGKPTLDNAVLLCRPCHVEKTKQDVAAIAKAKRREALHIGAKPAPAKPLKSAGFRPAAPQRKASKLEPGSKDAQIRAMRERQSGAEGG
jgi:5-methylcytosine-specific restriction endonuclease McrA